MKAEESLCKAIEAALHMEMRTPKDFEQLRERIYLRLHQMVSTSTLKRVWGYLHSEGDFSIRTLDILAQFIGYENYKAFCEHASSTGELPSNLVLNRHINVDADLVRGDRLTLFWLPDRTCELSYEGDMKFVVTASENTRLKEGDTFCCSLIVEGEPLYLSNLLQPGQQPTNYVCGKQGGIRFEKKIDR